MTPLIQVLKDNGEDFEFYPTTKAILRTVFYNLSDSSFSLLDIGAGNGNIFSLLSEIGTEQGKEIHINKYAIEKSQILINQMPEDVFIIGTDFLAQTLIDKQVDVIFCNPPYKEYVTWAKKIIKEANAKYIFLVLPERWKDNPEIQQALKLRFDTDAPVYEILESTDFLDGERAARCKVDVIKIKLKESSYGDRLRTDPFDLWFDETFKINADKEQPFDSDALTNRREDLKKLVAGQNLVERLAEIYQVDMQKLQDMYKKIESLDEDILKELNINVAGLKEGLKLKIKNLKNLYWQELFNNLDKITEKLTSKSRKSMLEKLNKNTSIDFTATNAYAVVIWTLKNTNKYIDIQLCEVYKGITEPENVKNYKSNKRMIDHKWRWKDEGFSHYSLDYRIVCQKYNCFPVESYTRWNYDRGLEKDVHDFLNDIRTVAINLGFDVRQTSLEFDWLPGQENEFFYYEKDQEKIFMSVRAYKKGTVHIKFNQEFMQRFNIEAARLNQWITSPSEYAGETETPLMEVMKHYNRNIRLVNSSIPLLPQFTG